MHCFITCDHMSNSRKILLYTLPVCQTHFVYYTDWKKTSLSNITTGMSYTDMDLIHKLELNLTKSMNIRSIEPVRLIFNELIMKKSNFSLQRSNLLFRHVRDLKLGNDGEWPKHSLEFLSTIVDLSQLIKLSLSVNFIPEHMFHTISQIKLLFNQTSNLRSLLLYDYWTPENCMKRMETLCSIISPNIKHLQIRVKDFNDIKYILERLEHLTSVTFEYAQMLTVNHQDLMQSLVYLNRYSSIWDSQCALHIWFGKKKE